MPSRFDLAIGKIPKTPPKEKKEPIQGSGFGDPLPRRNFLSQLNLVNEVTDARINLAMADFNLALTNSVGRMQATINISIPCPIEDAQRLLEGISCLLRK
jgi:hypothetical protein